MAARTTGVIALGGSGRAFAVVNGADLDVWLVTEVCRASLVRSLQRTLQLSYEEVGIIVSIYTWERWQLHCMLHKLLHLAAHTQETGLSLSSSPSPTASNKVKMGVLGA